MEVINLNLIPTGALPVVHASQYDEGRTFRANLMDGSVVYTLDGTETLECDVKKPDGKIVTVAVNNTSDSYVEIDTTLQMCACAGDSLAELHITKGAQEIGTLNFILAVERSPLEGGIESESEIDNLATQVAGLVASEVENQYDSANVIFDDEPTEGHGNGYTVKSEGIKRAINNVQDAVDEVNDKADTNATAIGSLSQLTTTDKSSLVGAVNEVVSTKATTGSAITFAPETGITANATSAVINKTVLLNLTFAGSFTLNTWKKIGAMNVTPSTSTVYVAGIHSSDGLYAGMIQIRSDKGIYFYPKTAISGTVGCTANFNIT